MKIQKQNIKSMNVSGTIKNYSKKETKEKWRIIIMVEKSGYNYLML